MFTHITIGTNDMDRAKAFYDAVIGALGGPPGKPDPIGRLFYSHAGGRLMITTPIDGQPATPGNGATIGFAAASPAQADAWHQAGIDNGGQSVEDPPGIRQGTTGQLYLAYLRDPDGNKLCALHRLPA